MCERIQVKLMVDFSGEEEEPTPLSSLADKHSFTVEADKITYADAEEYQNRMLEDLAMLSFRYTLDFCRNLMVKNPDMRYWQDPLRRTLDP